MAMSSYDLKQLVAAFGADFRGVQDRLYEALTGDLPDSELPDALADARRKLADYEELLARAELDELDREYVRETWGERVDTLRERAAALAAKLGGA
ncbi:MAG TPA: hypothetical protein VFQ38_19420 [Longimicrobiales bacterium]|nr:hypothetical protein [Longimicrobiales bacterium]